ncbi:DoxX family protein [Methylosoma difficile]
MSDAQCACVISQVKKLTAQTETWFNQQTGGYAPIFLRILLAYEFGEAGYEKLVGDNWFSGLAFPIPFNLLSADVNWQLAMCFEIIGPIALVLGLATRFFSVVLMLLTVIAIAVVHWPAEWHSLAELWQGYAITDKGFGNYKLPLMYLLMLASLFCSGAGSLSLDAWWVKRGQENCGV